MGQDPAGRKRHTSGSDPHGAGLRALAGAAFGLLAVAICVRPLWGESPTVRLTDLLSGQEAWWNGSPGVAYVAHLVAAAGVAAGGLWVALARRRWHFSGLEPAAFLLICAAAVAVPQASDKRLSINLAVETILPIVMAAVLYQLLVHRLLWRRVLLAGVVAAAAANCWTATSQRFWQFDETLRHYQQNRATFWKQQGKSLTDPEVQIYEARLRSRQPLGFFYHPNVMASLLLMGLAGTVAAAVGAGWWRTGARADGPQAAGAHGKPSQGRRTAEAPDRPGFPLVPAVKVGLAVLAAGHLVVIFWVRSAGSMVALLAAAVAGALAWRWRDRPKRLAAALVVGLIVLEGALIGLALDAEELYPRLAGQEGKFKSMAVRLNYWAGALELFGEQPLTGVGPGQFGKAYLRIKAPYAAEEVMHPHNWLLAVAAEWGVLGVAGLALALGGCGWAIVRSLAQGVEQTRPQVEEAVLPAFVVVLACWALVVPGLLPAGPAVAVLLTWDSALVGLLAAVVVSLSGLRGRGGLAVLLAGLVAFVVHATVEMTPGVPGAAWPFWGLVALAMAWAAPRPWEDAAGLPPRRMVRAAVVLPGAVAVATLALTVPPLRAIVRMGEARTADSPATAVHLFEQAAQADPLDPAPLVAAASVRQSMADGDRDRATEHYKYSIEMYERAVQRDPLDNVLWHDLAMVRVRLARQTGDAKAAQSAVTAMERAVTLYPNWPRGWYDLAQAAMEAIRLGGPNPALVEMAVEAIDRTLDLDQAWPAEDPRRLSPETREQLSRMRETVRLGGGGQTD